MHNKKFYIETIGDLEKIISSLPKNMKITAGNEECAVYVDEKENVCNINDINYIKNYNIPSENIFCSYRLVLPYVEKNLAQLIENFLLTEACETYVADENMQELFEKSGITHKYGEKHIDWSWDDNCELAGCSDGDVLGIDILIQKNKKYFCTAVAKETEDGLKYTLDLTEIWEE